MGKRKQQQRARQASHSPLKDTAKKARAADHAITSSERLALLSDSKNDPFTNTLRKFKQAYRIISKLHEPICPVGSEEHSITGNVTAGSFGKLASILQSEVPPEYQLTAESIYLDIGSGMGRPTLCMACLPIAISAGIEVQSGQYRMSLLALKNMRNADKSATEKEKILQADVYLKHCNVMQVQSLEGATHVHMFLWANPQLLKHAMALVAWSDAVKALSVIYRGTPSELSDLGLVSDRSLLSGKSQKIDESTEYTKQLSVHMPGQHSYSSYVLCITPERRARMRAVLSKPTVDESQASPLQLTKLAGEMAAPEWWHNIDAAIGLNEARATRSSRSKGESSGGGTD